MKCPKCGAKCRVPKGDPPHEEAKAAERPPVGGTLATEGSEPPSPQAESSASEDADPYSAFVVYDDDTEIVYEYEDEPVAQDLRREVDVDKVAIPRIILYTIGGLIAVVAFVAFCIGWWGGSQNRRFGEEGAEAIPGRVYGVVYYRDNEGKEVPDLGAVVIVFPRDKIPDEKFELDGFRPQDPPPDGNSTNYLGLQLLGGGIGRTDDKGRYEIGVPSTGKYYILFISNHSTRAAGDDPSSVDLAEIGRYIILAPDLLGESAYHWEESSVRSKTHIPYRFGR